MGGGAMELRGQVSRRGGKMEFRHEKEGPKGRNRFCSSGLQLLAGVGGWGKFRVEFDGALEVGGGAIPVALGGLGNAAVVVGVGVLRIDGEGAGVVCNRAVLVAQLEFCEAAVEACEGGFRVQLDAEVVIGHCALEVTLGLPVVAAADVGIGIFWINGDGARS